MNGPTIRFDQVAFAYNEAQFLFDATVPDGAITALMGPSGSGKSTLLNLVAGFETPKSGRILIGEQDMRDRAPAARPVSMIFQENNLFAHLTVEQNVGLGRSPSLKLTADDKRAIADALASTGMQNKNNRLPRELSGGERQRVAIARALVRQCPVLLLDEPFASLGPALRADMLDEIRALQARLGLTVLFVTHHPEDASRLADHVLFLENGHITAQGPAKSFLDEQAPAAFRRYMGDAG
ncbi:thiamine ABC transporter ATP-binding protein [Tianweitania sp. BSSL-BM11]|uniref:Thiamine ABC transporter ATP-binding protein n=1 Tax=Tianweitania aestuarii TaxID=2814886 RepID=A0ABS5RZ48_9HYPH|nr:thiamine ABC transporter ATP-binding protein [Tianweitania aestuarii]MBS9722329.1 thiamine ABC transporter ATP-binding protein [Tianweitania aestuarii]